MFRDEDIEYLNNSDYNLALEKYYDSTIYNTEFSNISVEKVYPFSNEKLMECFKYFKGIGNKVLTVGSSGDQALTALYHGAKDITVVDANLYTKYYIDYKIAAIKNLSAEDFNYYFLDLKAPFCPEVFTKIFHDLDKDSQTFWGTIFMEVSDEKDSETFWDKLFKDEIFELPSRVENDEIPVRSRIWTPFFDMKNTEDSLFDIKNYDGYDKLQQILKDGDFSLKFINADFSKFPEVAKDKYDLILLSNVYDYVRDIDGCATFSQVINKLYDDHLNNDGKMQILYAFDDELFGDLSWNMFSDMFPNKGLVDFHLEDGAVNYVLHKKHQLIDDIIFYFGARNKGKNPYHIPKGKKKEDNTNKEQNEHNDLNILKFLKSKKTKEDYIM